MHWCFQPGWEWSWENKYQDALYRHGRRETSQTAAETLYCSTHWSYIRARVVNRGQLNLNQVPGLPTSCWLRRRMDLWGAVSIIANSIRSLGRTTPPRQELTTVSMHVIYNFVQYLRFQILVSSSEGSTSGSRQNNVHLSTWNVPLLHHAIRTLQCWRYFPAFNGCGDAGAASRDVSRLLGWHRPVLKDSWKTFGEIGQNTWKTRVRWTQLKPEKCRFMQRSVSFLGHVVSGDEIATDPE